MIQTWSRPAESIGHLGQGNVVLGLLAKLKSSPMVLFPQVDFGQVLADEDRPKFAESLDDSKNPVVQSPVSFDCLLC